MSNISPIGDAMCVANMLPDAWVEQAADTLIENTVPTTLSPRQGGGRESAP